MLYSGLCSISFRNLSVEEIVELCKVNHIQYIEWGSDVHVPINDLDNAQHVASLCKENNIAIYSYGTYFKTNEVGDFEKYCQVGKILGAKVLRLWCGEKSSNLLSHSEYLHLVETIKKCAFIAKKYNQIIAFENHGNTYCDTYSSIQKLLKDVNQDNVKTYFQPDYWNTYSNDKARIDSNLNTIYENKENIVCVHVYAWEKTKRLLLKAQHYEWQLYLNNLIKDKVVCYLEFFKDDDTSSFKQDAKKLNDLLNYFNQVKRNTIKTYTNKELNKLIQTNYKENIIYSFDFVHKQLNKNFQQNKKEAILNICAKYKTEKSYSLKKEDWLQYLKDGNRIEFEKKFFYRRNRLYNFVLGFLISKDTTLISYIETEIINILNDYSWVLPPHFSASFCQFDDIKEHQYGVDLLSSLTASSLAEISFLLNDYLAKDLLSEIKINIKNKVLNVFYKPYEWKKEYKINNWASVCGSNTAIAAIYTLDKDELISILSECIDLNNKYINSFKDDGGCVEGYSYWNYGFCMYIIYADLLKQITNSKIDLFKNDKVKKISGFGNDMILNNRNCISFGDVDLQCNYFYGIMCFLNKTYESIVPKKEILLKDFNKDKNPLQSTDWIIEFKDFLWSFDYKEQNILDQTHIYKETGFYVNNMKNNLVTLAVKTGHNFEPHNQLDVGNIILYLNAVPLLVDTGRSKYTNDYFDEDKRYSYFSCSAFSHNIPIIDNNMEKPGCENRSENIKMTNNSISFNLEKAYLPIKNLKSFQRKITTNKKTGSFVLKDRLIFSNSKHTIKEHFVLLNKPKINKNQLIMDNGEYSYILIFKNLKNLIHVEEHYDVQNLNIQKTYLVDAIYELNENEIEIEIQGKLLILQLP